MNFATLTSLFAIALQLLFVTGCSQGPSYADLLVIYNQEVEALDRLTAKRDQLVARQKELSKPSKMEKAADVLGGILDRAEQLKSENEARLPADADGLLDQALENANQVESIANEVLDSVGSEDESSRENAEELAKITAELEEVEKEIEKQQARVDRARENRDAAE